MTLILRTQLQFCLAGCYALTFSTANHPYQHNNFWGPNRTNHDNFFKWVTDVWAQIKRAMLLARRQQMTLSSLEERQVWAQLLEDLVPREPGNAGQLSAKELSDLGFTSNWIESQCSFSSA
jgi:hypothetical protein